MNIKQLLDDTGGFGRATIGIFSFSCLSNPLIVVMKRGAKRMERGYRFQRWNTVVGPTDWRHLVNDFCRTTESTWPSTGRTIPAVYKLTQWSVNSPNDRVCRCSQHDEHTQPPRRTVVAPIGGESHRCSGGGEGQAPSPLSTHHNNNNNTNPNHTHTHTHKHTS